jgi:hypothetical protein
MREQNLSINNNYHEIRELSINNIYHERGEP